MIKNDNNNVELKNRQDKQKKRKVSLCSLKWKGLLQYRVHPSQENSSPKQNEYSTPFPSPSSSPSSSKSTPEYLSPNSSPSSSLSCKSDPFPSPHHIQHHDNQQFSSNSQNIPPPSVKSSPLRNDGFKNTSKEKRTHNQNSERYSILGELNPSFLKQQSPASQPLVFRKRTHTREKFIRKQKGTLSSQQELNMKKINRNKSTNTLDHSLSKHNVTEPKMLQDSQNNPIIRKSNRSTSTNLSKVSISALLN
eukprot:gb/GECH01008048.1/.p1 GENE.gb/GECH01008048.1/~~gb/GECH01008048.1/.p1  ORF type:complete len:250 (+),score=78.98 gb/GECH01008048.1/:1-750(+)